MARTTVSRLRFQNINSVIAILNKQAPLKASKIAEISGLSVVSVNKILNDLSAVNMISINSDTERTGGRFAKSFALDYDAHQILVIQIVEQHKIMTATATITNLNGDAVTTPIDKTVVTLSDLTNLILKVMSDSEVRLRGIVIGIPGAVSNDIITNADMTSLIGINLKESVEKLTGIDTFVMNDVNAMIYGAEPKLVDNADYLAQDTMVGIKARSRQFEDMQTVLDTFMSKFATACESITCDRGIEFTSTNFIHSVENTYNKKIYFSDPQAPGQRGTNERLNRELRRIYPVGYNFTKITQKRLQESIKDLNRRPRHVLGYQTPEHEFVRRMNEIIQTSTMTASN